VTDIVLTNHAKKRLKQRLGLPKSACERAAQSAFDTGHKHSDAKGKARRYLDHLYLLYLQYEKANNIRVKGQHVYLFSGNVLVTVLNLPRSISRGFGS
jgi:hypothetical protein